MRQGQRRGQHRPVPGKGSFPGKGCFPKVAGSSGISGHAHRGEQDSCELHFVSINERNAKNTLCFGGKRCADASSSELDPQGNKWGKPQEFLISTEEINPHHKELLMSGETDISQQCHVTVPHPLSLAGTETPPGAFPAQGD